MDSRQSNEGSGTGVAPGTSIVSCASPTDRQSSSPTPYLSHAFTSLLLKSCGYWRVRPLFVVRGMLQGPEPVRTQDIVPIQSFVCISEVCSHGSSRTSINNYTIRSTRNFENRQIFQSTANSSTFHEEDGQNIELFLSLIHRFVRCNKPFTNRQYGYSGSNQLKLTAYRWQTNGHVDK